MTSFRSFLARERLVPVEQLDRALQRQILYGEDLSVNLLEMGAVDEDELAQFLGMFHRLPIVTRSDLRSVGPAIVARVPPALALRHRVCPVAVADDAMVVAATRQLDKVALDELRKAAGLSVSLAIATPVTLAWGLNLHYGAELPPRFQRLVDKHATPGPAPAQPPAGSAKSSPPPPEEAQRPRRASGVIVMPDDLPNSAEAGTELPEPAEQRSTPEASMPPPPDAASEPGPPEPPTAEVAAADAAEEVLRGVSLSHDNPADRLLEMVLGPPSQPPPPPDEPAAVDGSGPGLADLPVADVAAAVLARPFDQPAPTAPVDRPEDQATTEPGIAPPALPPVEPARPLPITKPIPPVARGTAYGRAVEEPAAAVVRVQSVMLGPAEERPAERPPRPSGMPAAVEAMLQPSPAAAPRGDLVARIQKLDTLGTPTEVLRYSFQLFSAAFRVGMLFDTTTRTPRLRDAFGVRTGAAGFRGRELPEDVIPSPVRNAAQPLLAPLAPEGALADQLAELFGDVPANALFLPVSVGSRVVAVLYGDNRESATSFDDVRDLFHLAWAAGTRLGDLVRRRRRLGPDEAAAGEVDDTERGMPPGSA